MEVHSIQIAMMGRCSSCLCTCIARLARTNILQGEGHTMPTHGTPMTTQHRCQKRVAVHITISGITKGQWIYSSTHVQMICAYIHMYVCTYVLSMTFCTQYIHVCIHVHTYKCILWWKPLQSRHLGTRKNCPDY